MDQSSLARREAFLSRQRQKQDEDYRKRQRLQVEDRFGGLPELTDEEPPALEPVTPRGELEEFHPAGVAGEDRLFLGPQFDARTGFLTYPTSALARNTASLIQFPLLKRFGESFYDQQARAFRDDLLYHTYAYPGYVYQVRVGLNRRERRDYHGHTLCLVGAEPTVLDFRRGRRRIHRLQGVIRRYNNPYVWRLTGGIYCYAFLQCWSQPRNGVIPVSVCCVLVEQPPVLEVPIVALQFAD